MVGMITEQRGPTWKMEALDYIKKSDLFAGMKNGNNGVCNTNTASNNTRGCAADPTNQETVTVSKAACKSFMDQVTILGTAVDTLRKEKGSPNTTDRHAGSEENCGLRE